MRRKARKWFFRMQIYDVFFNVPNFLESFLKKNSHYRPKYNTAFTAKIISNFFL